MHQPDTRPHALRNGGELRSTLADDPDMRELVGQFVESLGKRVTLLESLLLGGETAELRRAAHQLKGAGGGYGFDPISAAAGALERSVDAGASHEELRASMDELASLCRRASV